MNSSLPGWYSQRSRTLAPMSLAAELYWTRALANRNGVSVNVVRVVTSVVITSPAGILIQLSDTPGSIDTRGVISSRPRDSPPPVPNPTVVFVPPKKPPCCAVTEPLNRRCGPSSYDNSTSWKR